ncbi:MAG TPA: DUF2865 domain-containing protein [Pseudolabrys sp.]|nr:DUF2865 domain-containing protein [Pseudolabrys sp.]
MLATGRALRLRVITGLLAAGALTVAAPASAGFFERLFGGLQQPRHSESYSDPPDQVRSYAPFGNFLERIRPQSRNQSGPVVFCVRTCDGHYFPVQNRPGMSAAQACHAFCPASTTRLYSGNGIDHATSNGARYSDLDTAFLFRKQSVAGCTCNGRAAFGLAHIDVRADPTLKPGDVVATRHGMVAFTGMKNDVAEFAPVESYSGLPKDLREKIAAMRLMPPTPGEGQAAQEIPPPSAKGYDDDRHSAQNAR